jgi:protein ImuB
MFGALYLADGSTDGVLDVARAFTPRFEVCGPRDLVLDLSGLTRLFGDPRAMAHELRRVAMERGLPAAVAIAGTGTAARLLARAGVRGQGSAVSVIEPGAEASAVAPLPLALLADIANDEPSSHPHTLALSDAPSHPRTVAPSHHLLSTFRRWGLRTLGDLAALPADEIAARLGTDGLRWHRLAEGRDLRPLRPVVADERFEQALDLEWPVEGLEPLSFVLGRLLEPLAALLERRGRGAAVLHLRLHLVTRAVHERSLELPAPMRDARTLRTLLLLDLESHPAPAAIDRVVVAVDPTPARVLQFSLLQRPLPSPEQLSTLNARLSALMGEGRCGSPAVADSWRPGTFGIKPFEPSEAGGVHSHGTPRQPPSPSATAPKPTSACPPKPLAEAGLSAARYSVGANSAANHLSVALRRFRFPVPARVRVEDDRPVHVAMDRRGLTGGRVETCAGPWRGSGEWWVHGPRSHGVTEDNQNNLRVSGSPWPVEAWDRDEWDVTLSDHATYRVFRDRATGTWFLEGMYD